ncbi:Molybdopterin synthase catalytic subunit [Oleoguttula sp. CCFEE 5521]
MASSFPTTARFAGEQALTESSIHVSLTYDPLVSQSILDLVKSPSAGAIVLFAGTTRATFLDRHITHLAYSAYVPLALRTLLSIARYIKSAHNLVAIAITHRLGVVPIGEESVLISVSSPHRKAAWLGGEECLEKVKERVEIWKEEWFEDGGVWRANRDGAAGVKVADTQERTSGDMAGEVAMERGADPVEAGIHSDSTKS